MPKKILVRGTTWLGDAVMTIPALVRLRNSFPDSHITLLAPPRAAEVFTGFPQVDEIYLYRRKEEGTAAFLNAMKFMRREKIELALLFQNAFEAALLSFLGGAKTRVGFDTQGRGFLLTHKLPRTDALRNRHQTHDYLDVVTEAERACLGKELTPERNNIPALVAADGQLQAAEKLCATHKILLGKEKLIVLNAGATNSRAKCWPENYFATLADKFVNETSAKILLIGAGSERENAERIIAQMQHKSAATNFAGVTSIPELIGLLARSDLLVTNDTGPAHVGAALGIPTLTIFGPTNEFETAPLGTRAEIIRADGIDCARCMHRDCPIDHRCMTRIVVDEVFARSLKLIAV